MIQVAAGDVSACLSQYHLAIITQDTATYQAIGLSNYISFKYHESMSLVGFIAFGMKIH